MTDTTQARRDLLTVLLDRAERGALLDAEAALLRLLVAAEQDGADRATDRAAGWEQRCVAANQARARALTRTRLAEHQGEALRVVLADVLSHFTHHTHPGEPCLQTGHVPVSTVRRWHATLQGEQPDTALARVTAALTAEHYARAEARTVASPEEHSAAMAAVALDALDGEQPAEPEPEHGAVKRVGPPFPMPPGAAEAYDAALPLTWHGDIEGYRTGRITGVLAHSQAPGTLVRCAPFQHPDCPGHLAPPFCGETREPQCTATITGRDTVNPDRIIRCEKPAGHYDEANAPTGPGILSTGGWHSHNDGGRAWCDRAQDATPHRDSPQCRAQAHPFGNVNLRCTLPLGHDGDHHSPGLPFPYEWPDDIAVYPVTQCDDAPGDAPS